MFVSIAAHRPGRLPQLLLLQPLLPRLRRKDLSRGHTRPHRSQANQEGGGGPRELRSNFLSQVRLNLDIFWLRLNQQLQQQQQVAEAARTTVAVVVIVVLVATTATSTARKIFSPSLTAESARIAAWTCPPATGSSAGAAPAARTGLRSPPSPGTPRSSPPPV